MEHDIKQVGGVWLPAHETHLVDWMRKMAQRDARGRFTYQRDKREAALKWVRQWRTAIDIGAHCGLWSMDLATRFDVLHAFEPIELHRRCFALNVSSPLADPSVRAGVTLHPCALGEHAGTVAMHTTPGSSGDSWVKGGGDIPIRRLDDFALPDVDFLKLDCEGYELAALRGAEETLRRCRPCVIVEQKPGRAAKFGFPDTGAVDYLQSLGAELRLERSGDYVLSWD